MSHLNSAFAITILGLSLSLLSVLSYAEAHNCAEVEKVNHVVIPKE